MPQGDHTGPMGQGPGTGRSLRVRYGKNSQNDSKGFRKGRGGGRGCGSNRNLNFPIGSQDGDSYRIQTPDKQNEITLLKSQAASLKLSLENIEKRLKVLEQEKN